MTRTFLPLIVAVAILAPARALAQLETPKMPAPLPVETVELRSVKNELTKARYTRAGTKPLEYRLSDNPTFSNASWQALQEGATSTVVEAGRTFVVGTVPIPTSFRPNVSRSNGCEPQFMKYRVFLQFRIRNAAMQMINSAIRGDSTCVVTGG